MNKNYEPLNPKNIRMLLQLLGKRLDENGVEAELTVLGGAAMHSPLIAAEQSIGFSQIGVRSGRRGNYLQ